MILIDFYYLIKITLPPFLRGINTISLLNAIIKPLSDIQNNFYQFYEDKKYELTFNGQVIYLEHILNDKFDPILRRIYIGDAEQTPNVYVFNDSEDNEAIYLFNNSDTSEDIYLFNASEETPGLDFIVFIPIGFTYNDNLMKYYINKFKTAGKRYQIQEI
jgi:hypothetical protein